VVSSRSVLRPPHPVRPTAKLDFSSSYSKQRRFTPILYSFFPSCHAARDRAASSDRSSEGSAGFRAYPTTLRDFPHLSSPKKGQAGSFGYQPANNQPVRSATPFQKGGVKARSERDTAQSLDETPGFTGRVPSHTTPSTSTSVLPISVGRAAVRMVGDAIWLSRRTTNFHSIDANSGDSSTTARYSFGSVHGRHPHPVTLRTTSDQGSGHVPTDPRIVRLLTQCEEVPHDTNPADRFPGCDGVFGDDDVLSSTEEVRSTPLSCPDDARQGTKGQTSQPLVTPIIGRSPAISVRLHSANTTPFKRFDRGSPHRSASMPHRSVTTSNQGIDLVGEQHESLERKGDISSPAHDAVRYRRIGEGLGRSSLSSNWSTSGLPRVLHLGDDQQHEGADSDSKRSRVVSESSEMARFFDSSPNRQSNSDVVYQPHGWSFTTPVSHRRTDPFVLSGTQAHPLSRVPAWSGERDSGSALPNRERYLGESAESSAVPTARSDVGSSHDRCVCVGIQHTDLTLCESASRHGLSVHRHVLSSAVATRERMVLPHFPSDRSTTAKAGDGTAVADTHRSSMVQPAVVAAVVAPLPGLASPPAPIIGVPPVVVGREAKGGPDSMVVGRSALIRKHFAAQGLSDSAIDVWFLRHKHGEHSGTNAQHDSMWKGYHVWCASTGRRPLDFNVADILRYADEVIIGTKGRTAATAVAFISMCSTTHQAFAAPGTPALSAHPLITGFRKGIVKKIPRVSLKPASYYSLYSVFRHLRTLSSDDTKCSLPVLRNKLIVLLAIDGMARSRDIGSITRDTIRFTDTQVHFSYYNTKEAKTVCEVPSSIGRYDEDKLICTVSVMQAYMTRTENLRTTRVPHLINGESVMRQPLLLSDMKDKKGFYFELGHERIAKVNLITLRDCGIAVFTAHSFRGAAASKVVNLGGSLPLVLARARWAGESTFRKHYWKAKVYRQHSTTNRHIAIEFILRMRTD